MVHRYNATGTFRIDPVVAPLLHPLTRLPLPQLNYFHTYCLLASCTRPHLFQRRDQTRELMRVEEEQEDDKQLALQIVAAARMTAPRLAKMSSISEHRNRWVAYQVRLFTEVHLGCTIEVEIQEDCLVDGEDEL